MRITQCHVSKSIEQFREPLKDKYALTEIIDILQPVVFFGMYRDEDVELIKTLKGILVWCGSDSIAIPEEWLPILKDEKIIHIAKSKFISDDLNKFDIPHTILPITPTSPTSGIVCPRGDDMYFYYSASCADFYGMYLTEGVKKRTGLKIHRVAHGDMNPIEVIETYKKCFLGLRLTAHDGLPNTVLELALMGRKSIHNGEMPCAIPYKDVDDICESVMREYDSRHEPNEYIAQATKDYLNIGDAWLNYPNENISSNSR